MGIIDALIEKLRDKTRDEVCSRLCAIGVDARMAERGQPEEHIIVASPGWYFTVRRDSLGLIEIRDSPIRWVNVARRTLGGGTNTSKDYSNQYLIFDPNIPTRRHLRAKTVRVKNVPLIEGVTDLRWEGYLEGGCVNRMNEDILLKKTLIEVAEDIEVVGYPDYECWAIATKWLPADRITVSRQGWDCYTTIARYLLEASGK